MRSLRGMIMVRQSSCIQQVKVFLSGQIYSISNFLCMSDGGLEQVLKDMRSIQIPRIPCATWVREEKPKKGSCPRLERYRRIGSNVGEGSYSSVDVYKLVEPGTATRSLSIMKDFYLGIIRRSQCPVYSKGGKVSVESGVFQLRRELGILACLRRKSDHIVQLERIMHDYRTQRIAIVMNYAGNPVMQYNPVLGRYSAWINDGSWTYIYRRMDTTQSSNVAVLHPVDALTCMRHLLSALTVVHQEGIVHKDIKPENILINNPLSRWRTQEGLDEKNPYDHGRPIHVTLCDFNSAEQVPDGIIYDAQGTVLFSPPEVFGRIDPKEGVDGYARDMWSVGVVGYCMLTGRTPVEGDRALEIQLKLIGMKDEVTHMSLPSIPGVNPRFKKVVEDMLSVDPMDRPTARAALSQLKSI